MSTSSLLRGLFGLVAGAALFARVDAHAILTKPLPRAGANNPNYNTGFGQKIVGFPPTDADVYSCGTSPPPASAPPAANIFSISNTAAAFPITVGWETTLPHDNAPGVSVKLITSPTQNWRNAMVLATGKQSGSDGPNSIVVNVPAGVTCTNCVLQWMWQSQDDGGMYIGCADITLKAAAAPATPAPTSTVAPTNPPTDAPTDAPTASSTTQPAGSTTKSPASTTKAPVSTTKAPGAITTTRPRTNSPLAGAAASFVHVGAAFVAQTMGIIVLLVTLMKTMMA